MSSDRGWRWILDEAKRARARNALLPEHAKPVVTRPAGIGSSGLTAAERECAQLRSERDQACALAAQRHTELTRLRQMVWPSRPDLWTDEETA